jgi:large subunit ribosomal protein L25
MQQVKVNAELREKKGSRESRRLRREGRIPAILYGHDLSEIMLSLDAASMEKLLGNEGYNGIIDLKIKGGDKIATGPLLALLKSYQADPLSRMLTHVDFYKVDLEEKVVVSVPLHITGIAPGVKAGGVLDIVRRELETRCLPNRIPEAITIDVSQMELGDIVHVQDIPFPEGVEVLADTNFTVVAVQAPSKIEEAAPVAEEGAEEASAGEEASADKPEAADGEKKES